MEYASNLLSLKSVVIGCRNEMLYDKLCSTLGLSQSQPSSESGLEPTKTTTKTACSGEDTWQPSEITNFVQNWALSKQYGRKIFVRFGGNLSEEAISALGLSDLTSSESISSINDSIAIMETSPFSEGNNIV